ncbi:G2/mitotic-specific cyclin cig1 [Habropoda laboriosa]|uniref:G2/mitotic-specific cyclin cig1 n=1 Tax=Habropoda laboriosa TaxID=597456 RepID=A0A0L7QKJ8_9HYME|nr:G2/mitotic-specific cyclin cig1 [Habropoda laboriosa]
MAHPTRNAPSATARSSLSSGKENACPPLSAVSGRKVSFAGAGTACQTRVSLRAIGQRRKETGVANAGGSRAIGQTYSGKKTPFHVHCDERNVSPRQDARDGLGRRDDAKETSVKTSRKRWATVKPQDGKKPLPPSKIPRRSRGAKDRDHFPAALQYHTEYIDQLVIVEREREKKSPALSKNFLTECHINAEQRRLVVIFMIHLGTHCRYPSYIVYQSVKLFDLVMDTIRVDTAFIQLCALASLWIALKKQENFHKIPTATSMVALAKGLYAGREDLLIEYERKILQVLNFNVSFADAFSLFTYHLINCIRFVDISDETTAFLYNTGCYLIDLTLLDEQFCRTAASLIAVTAAELAFGLVLDVAPAVHARPRWLFWRGLLFAATPHMPDRIDRFQDKEIDQTRIRMLRRLLSSGKKHHGFDVVYKKYSRSRYSRISESLLERAGRVSPTETFYDP